MKNDLIVLFFASGGATAHGGRSKRAMGEYA